MTLVVGHHFSRADARVRLQQLLEYWKQRFQIAQEWTSEDDVLVSGTISGVPFHALLAVADTHIRCEATDPGMLLRNSAHDYVQNKLRKYLHPHYAEP